MQKWMIVDGSGFLYRAYHGFPNLTNQQGQEVGAIYGFWKLILRLFLQKPDYFVIARDSKAKTIRAEQFEEYKANRAPMPEGMRWQVLSIKEMTHELNIPNVEIPGYEADDIIGSFAVNLSKNPNNHVTIVSADKDLKQFISENVIQFDPMKNITTKKSDFIAEWGFEPKYFADYLAILGDASDNIPGVPGIGEKGAKELIKKYETIETIYQNLAEIAGSLNKKLIEGRESAFNSKKLTLPMLMEESNFESVPDTKKWRDIKKLTEILNNKRNFPSLQKALDQVSASYSVSQPSLFG